MLFWPLQAVTAEVTASSQISAGTAPGITWPAYGQSAVGTTEYGVLATSGAQARAPMASITKIVTALTVLDAKPIAAGQTGPTITFTAEDAARYNQYFMAGGTIARSDAGMQLTEHQILQGMLVSSANNYADSLAVWAYGSMDSYLAAAQAYLAKHGLSNTTVADASGFSPQSKSTPSDLVRIGTLALEQPVIAGIVSQNAVTIPGVGTLRNTNLLLGQEGIVGIKTGTTDEAGSCLLFAAKYTIGTTPVTIVGAALGGPNHAALARDVNAILASTKAGFQEVTLAELGQSFATYKTPWEAETKATTNKNTRVVTWPGFKTTQKISVTDISPGEPQAKKVGTAAFSIGSQKYTTDLVLDQQLEKPTWLWRLTHPQEVVRG